MTPKEIKTANEIKLMPDECIVWATRLENLMVCEKLNELGVLWAGSDIQPAQAIWDNRNHYQVNIDKKVRFASERQKQITATEWLNRHGIFVPGQIVLFKTEIWHYVNTDPVGADWSVITRVGEIGTADTVNIHSPFKPWTPIPEEPVIVLNFRGTKGELFDKLEGMFGKGEQP